MPSESLVMPLSRENVNNNRFGTAKDDLDKSMEDFLDELDEITSSRRTSSMDTKPSDADTKTTPNYHGKNVSSDSRKQEVLRWLSSFGVYVWFLMKLLI